MTPGETITILRQFNVWRRGGEDLPQPDPREIGRAIDSAVEMLEGINRLHAPSIMVAIIDDLQSKFDSEGITEYDSGDALIRLSDAIAAVEDNFVHPAPSVPDEWMQHAASAAPEAKP